MCSSATHRRTPPSPLALVESLERHAIACWIAPRDVKAGALYADAIVRAISNAKALVLVLSESAIGSSHVGKEVERASSKKRPIIALRIDNAPLTPALEYFLSESQWIEARAENKEPAYASLIDAIREPERAAPGINPAATPSAGYSAGGTAQGTSQPYFANSRSHHRRRGTCLFHCRQSSTFKAQRGGGNRDRAVIN